MLTGNYKVLYERLKPLIAKSRMFHDPLHTLAFGTDASFYRLVPKLVIKAKDEDEVSVILRECNILRIPVTFRAAGTSLSGQALTDSVLVVAGSHWKKATVEQDGAVIRLQPGLTGSEANRLLLPFGRKIGPDPASIDSAMIGGIAANNASGMCCGIAENSYQTLLGMRVILCDGSVLDTCNARDIASLRTTHVSLLNQLSLLHDMVSQDEELTALIRQKYKMKNTTGYSLNALVDFTDPVEILQHLMIGSEGTLGFIAEIRYKTVPEHPFKASVLALFPSVHEACSAVEKLQHAPVAAVEFIDRAGLRSVEDEKGLPVDLRQLAPGVSALLIETRAKKQEQLDDQIHQLTNLLGSFVTILPATFTDKSAECAHLWKIRKGMFPSVGAMRKAGTTVIIEDVSFPVDRLAEATADLQELFQRWGYNEAVIFGHALLGNLHFVFTQDFGIPSEVERYKNLMEDVVRLVVDKYNGALKAEHGTGRNMAPFVEQEWGQTAYELMKKLKTIFDPENLLNPGVILNDDPQIYLKHLKPIPQAHDTIDKCIECGFCEQSCVAAELTLSPRQRIAVYREIARLGNTGQEPHLRSSLLQGYHYAGNLTCATDGLCATSCPVKIDTGKLIKSIRSVENSKSKKTALFIAERMPQVTALMRSGLSFVDLCHRILGTTTIGGISSGLRMLSFQTLPQWNKWMPVGAKKIITPSLSDTSNKPRVVYFASCINRSMGPARKGSTEQLTEVMVRLIAKAGYEIVYPANLSALCCGMAFSSKGYTEAGKMKSNELEEALWNASEEGKLPILCDMSPCLFTMRENMGERMKLYEPVEFILSYLIDQLEIQPVEETIAVFPVCSLKKMGLETQLKQLAQRCAANVVVPRTNCCGFAGDKGFVLPELNTHGLRDLKSQLPAFVRRGYSNSRTCEIGLSQHSGIPFESIVYLVDEVSKAK